MNGKPLKPAHGAPLRLIVPGWYGMASVKWVSRIEALTAPFADAGVGGVAGGLVFEGFSFRMSPYKQSPMQGLKFSLRHPLWLACIWVRRVVKHAGRPRR